MSKRILFLAIGVVLLLGIANAFAEDETIPHTQQTLEMEKTWRLQAMPHWQCFL